MPEFVNVLPAIKLLPLEVSVTPLSIVMLAVVKILPDNVFPLAPESNMTLHAPLYPVVGGSVSVHMLVVVELVDDVVEVDDVLLDVVVTVLVDVVLPGMKFRLEPSILCVSWPTIVCFNSVCVSV